MTNTKIRFLPNAITVLALCTGLTSITFAYHNQFYTACWMIGIAAILDALDGPTARLLHSQSRMGAELDSLADCVNFGVCPAIILYLWALSTDTIGWGACLIYAVCAMLRLARFNTMLDDQNPKPWAKMFFYGIPSPGGALLALLPLVAYFRFHEHFFKDPHFLMPWTVIIGLAMVSRLPNIALKSLRIPPKFLLPALILLLLTFAAAFHDPLLTFMVIIGLFVLHLPYAYWKENRFEKHPELWTKKDVKQYSANIHKPRNLFWASEESQQPCYQQITENSQRKLRKERKRKRAELRTEGRISRFIRNVRKDRKRRDKRRR